MKEIIKLGNEYDIVKSEKRYKKAGRILDQLSKKIIQLKAMI